MEFCMAKRGRPRKTRPDVDLGTPELQMKRLAALQSEGPRRPNWPKIDTNAAESALGVLLWQGFLHDEYTKAKRMHDAGITFAGWWVLVHPKTFMQGTLGRFQPGGSSNADHEEAEANLKAASSFLARDRAVLDAVVNTAVYQRINLRQMEKLRTGLCRLMEWKRTQAERLSRKILGEHAQN
jgi:hypothetical protein